MPGPASARLRARSSWRSSPAPATSSSRRRPTLPRFRPCPYRRSGRSRYLAIPRWRRSGIGFGPYAAFPISWFATLRQSRRSSSVSCISPAICRMVLDLRPLDPGERGARLRMTVSAPSGRPCQTQFDNRCGGNSQEAPFSKANARRHKMFVGLVKHKHSAELFELRFDSNLPGLTLDSCAF